MQTPSALPTLQCRWRGLQLDDFTTACAWHCLHVRLLHMQGVTLFAYVTFAALRRDRHMLHGCPPAAAVPSSSPPAPAALGWPPRPTQFGAAMGLSDAGRAFEIARQIESFLHHKQPGEVGGAGTRVQGCQGSWVSLPARCASARVHAEPPPEPAPRLLQLTDCNTENTLIACRWTARKC